MSSISFLPAEALQNKSIEELNLYLTRVAENFEDSIGLKPSIIHIKENPLWYLAFKILKDKEKENAEPLPQGCKFYIVRRRRYCSKLASCSNGFCIEHDILQRTDILNKVPDTVGLTKGQNTSNSALDMNGITKYEVGKSSQKVFKKININRRMKKMTNPDAIQFSSPVFAPNWSAIYSNTHYPLFLDIGCGKGRFIKDLSNSTEFVMKYGQHNFVGVEIFESLVLHANNKWISNNLFYIAANINKSYQTLCFPNLTRVSIQFPDPWFEKKKLHRRVVNKELAEWLAHALPVDGEVFLVSDVLELAREMRKIFLDTQKFTLHSLHTSFSQTTAVPEESVAVAARETSDTGSVIRDVDAEVEDIPEGGWLSCRPYFVTTERDIVSEIRWRPVYRSFLVKF